MSPTPALLLTIWLAAVPDSVLSDTPLDVPLDADRPTFCLSPITLQTGRFQGETGTTWTRFDGSTSWVFGETLVRLGAAHGWELRLRLGSYEDLDAPQGGRSGLTDLGLGFKKRLSTARGARPGAALVVETSVPTGSLGSDGMLPSAALALAWWPQSRWSLATTLRWASVETPAGERVDQWGSGVALFHRAAERVKLFVEHVALAEDDGGRGDRRFVQAGAVYQLYDFQFDVRAGVGLDGRDPDRLFGLGGTVKW